MKHCPDCGAKLETPLGCGACGALFSPESTLTPFEVLGLEPGYELGAAELKKRLLRVSRVVHPDYFGSADAATRERAERASALVNEAHATLASDRARADWLVRWLGGPAESEKREMPTRFLLDVLEWNETLELARGASPGSAERAALVELRRVLRAQTDEVLATLAARLSPVPERASARLAEARADLNALRYLDNTLAQIDAVELESLRPN